MISPGAKGWINKYFDLVTKGTIKLEVKTALEIEETAFHAFDSCKLWNCLRISPRIDIWS